MEYRLVRISEPEEYIQIFREADSELIGSVIRGTKFGIKRYYKLRLEDEVFNVTRGLLNPRNWKVLETNIVFRWKLLGKGVKITTSNEVFRGGKPERGKITLTNSRGRTGFILDPNHFASKDMILLEDFDRLDLPITLSAGFLIQDHYSYW